jgi:hypothetical protein
MRESLGQRWVRGWLLIVYTYILFVFAFAPCRALWEIARGAPEEAGVIRVLLYTSSAGYALVVSPLAFYWAARKTGYTLREADVHERHGLRMAATQGTELAPLRSTHAPRSLLPC